MKFLPSLDRRDRNAVLVCLALVMVFITVIAIFSPRQRDESPVPSSYGVGTHGAKAAYLLLVRSGYDVERWEQPLSELVNLPPDSQPSTQLIYVSRDFPRGDKLAADNADQHVLPLAADTTKDNQFQHTVLILAMPFIMEPRETKKAIKEFLDHGGRVLATGETGSALIPDGDARSNSDEISTTVCHATPEGFDPLASSGEVDIESPVVWSTQQPAQRVEYRCGKKPVVVTYAAGKGPSPQGQIIWWASSTPLENASILRSGNLDLLLNSIGPRENTRVLWDESLHGDVRSPWSYTGGTPMRLLWIQCAIIAALLLFSMSRRSGPLRNYVETPRTTPVEFVESLGALYDRAEASNTAVVIAYERFRHHLERRLGFTSADMRLDAPALAQAIQTRLHYNHPELVADLADAEAAEHSNLSRRRALELVQALHDHSTRLGMIGHELTQSHSTQ